MKHVTRKKLSKSPVKEKTKVSDQAEQQMIKSLNEIRDILTDVRDLLEREHAESEDDSEEKEEKDEGSEDETP